MEETAANAPAPAPAPRSIGERLRAGRERAGLSVAAAAEKLHLDPKVIESLEANRFAELGASVYVRGHLRRYGDFVGESGIDLVNSYSARDATPATPDLTQVPHAERRSDPRRLVTPLVGLGCALVIALAIWWVLVGSRGRAPKPVTLGTPVAQPAPAAANSAAPVSSQQPGIPAERLQPASDFTPVPATTPATETAVTSPSPVQREESAPAREARLRLALSGESWVEVYDARGERLFYDVASAGSVHTITGATPLRVVLGNAAAVAVQVDGQQRDIPANSIDGDSARFVVNRSGTLSRARQ